MNGNIIFGLGGPVDETDGVNKITLGSAVN